MHMKLHVWKTVGGLLFCIGASALASAGCPSSSTTSGGGGGPPANCTADTTLSCEGDSIGYACDIGSNPEDEDTSLSCSDPAMAAGEDDYCCFTGFTGSSSSCVADDSVDCSAGADSFGYSCADSTDDPTTLDSSLNCSGGVADGSKTDFCCAFDGGGSSGGTSSGGIPAGCEADDSLDCSGGGTGISCPSGTTPDDTAGVCSVPQPSTDGTTDGFCCIPITDTGCTQDDTVTGGCDYPSYGFSCASGSPDPSTDDPSLTCSAAVTDPTTGDDDYCCSN
jgi:hypothetical protein